MHTNFGMDLHNQMLFYSWAAASKMGIARLFNCALFTPSFNEIVAGHRVCPVHMCVCINMHILVKVITGHLHFIDFLQVPK